MRSGIPHWLFKFWWMPTPARGFAFGSSLLFSVVLVALAGSAPAPKPAPAAVLPPVLVPVPPPPPPPPSNAAPTPAALVSIPEKPQRLEFKASDAYQNGAGYGGVFGRRTASCELQLVAAGDTIYMLNGSGELLWTESFDGAGLNDLPIIDGSGTVVVIGPDLMWIGYDAFTGHERWRRSACGRAWYSQIELYGRKRYLVVIDMSGYCDNQTDESSYDSLELCEGPTTVWSTRFPAGAQIRVEGARVFAITDDDGKEVTTEIRVPERFRPN